MKISEELKSRVDNLGTNYEQLKESDNVFEGALNVGKVGVSAVRVATGVLKTPIAFTIKAISKAMPVVWQVAAQPIHIPVALISTVIKPHSPYNGQTINKMGSFLGNKTESLLSKTADVVMRTL